MGQLEWLERLKVSEDEVQTLEAKLVQGQAAVLQWVEAKELCGLRALGLSEAADHTSRQVEDDLLRSRRDW